MKWNLLFFTMLLLAALACGTDSLPDVSIPEGAAATAQQGAKQAATAGAALVTRAAEVTIPAGALATARAAGGAAATAVAGGGDLVATVQAVGPQINVSVDSAALQEKLATAQPDANGNLTVVITDAELNQAIRIEEAAPDDSVVVENMNLAFGGGNVTIRGDVSKPLPAQLEAIFTPVVEDGTLGFDVISSSLMGIPLPAPILTGFTELLNRSLGDLMDNLPDNYVLESVAVGEGTLTVVARPQ